MNLKKIEKDMYEFKQNKSEEITLNSIPYPSFEIFCRLVFLEYLHLRVDQPFCPEKYKYNLSEKQNRQFPLKVSSKNHKLNSCETQMWKTAVFG